MSQPTSLENVSDRLLHGIFWSIALNTLIPVGLYQFSKAFISPSELTALILATLYPIGESLWGLIRERQLDPIAVIVLLGIATDAAALFLGGSPKILLLRESIFTGAFGLACFVSLLLPRPLMFYFGRYFMAGSDPAKRARFNASWELPEVRFSNRLITLVWGGVLVGELLLRVTLIYTISAAWVLVISPLLLGALTVGALIWSVSYGKRMRERVLPRLADRTRQAAAQLSRSSIQPPPNTRSPS